MSDSKLEISVSPRSTGKGNCRTMRKNGFIPAMIYGRNFKNKTVQLDARLVTKYCTREFESSLFTLKCDEDKDVNGQAVLLKSVVRHPATRKFEHVDFYAVDLTKVVKIKVEVRFNGTAAGIKDGGIFQPILREIEIESLPNKIPDFLSIDVSALALGESLHVSDVSFPEGAIAITPSTQTLCTITQSKAVEETTEDSASAAAPEEAKS